MNRVVNLANIISVKTPEGVWQYLNVDHIVSFKAANWICYGKETDGCSIVLSTGKELLVLDSVEDLYGRIVKR